MEQFRLPCHQNIVSLPKFVNFDNRGGFLSRRRWSWISQPNRVCFYDSPGGDWKCSVPSNGGRVVSVFELNVPEKGLSLLCLVFRKGGKSLLVVWNAALSCLLRAIHVPFCATCAAPVSGGTLRATGLFDQSVMEEFSGVVAIGCLGGRVLLVDLALGRQWTAVSMVTPRPCHLVSMGVESLSEARAKAVNSYSHLCVNVTGKINATVRRVGVLMGVAELRGTGMHVNGQRKDYM